MQMDQLLYATAEEGQPKTAAAILKDWEAAVGRASACAQAASGNSPPVSALYICYTPAAPSTLLLP